MTGAPIFAALLLGSTAIFAATSVPSQAKLDIAITRLSTTGAKELMKAPRQENERGLRPGTTLSSLHQFLRFRRCFASQPTLSGVSIDPSSGSWTRPTLINFLHLGLIMSSK
jgi:hypothetical protein